MESVQFNWHTVFNDLACSLFLFFFNFTLWKCLKLTFKSYSSQRHRCRKKKFKTRRRRIRRRRKQINHAYTKINKETKANRRTCIGWISRRRKNKDNFAFSLLLYKTPGSHAKIESNTGTKRYVREEAAKKEKEWRRESNPPLTAIVALFWGRGRQKWRRPPVHPLFFVRASARFSSFRSWFVRIRGSRSVAENRWRNHGRTPWYPYPMIVTQHPRDWSMQRRAEWFEAGQERLELPTKCGDKHKTSRSKD